MRAIRATTAGSAMDGALAGAVSETRRLGGRARPPAALRDLISDEEWTLLAPFVIESGYYPGRRPRDHRRVLDGVFWIARTDLPWRSLHPHFGKWSSVYRQFRRWTLSGIWDVLLEALGEDGEGPDDAPAIDSVLAQVPRHAGGAARLRWSLRTRILAVHVLSLRGRPS